MKRSRLCRVRALLVTMVLPLASVLLVNAIAHGHVGEWFDTSDLNRKQGQGTARHVIQGKNAELRIGMNGDDRTAERGVVQNLELVGQIGGDSFAVDIQGSYAYLGAGYEMIVLDISNPISPSVIGRVSGTPANISARDIAVNGNHAYIADWYSGLRIIDVSDPTQPSEISRLTMPDEPYGVATDGHYAYVADGDWGLRVVDVSNPAEPIEVGAYYMQGNARGVALGGGFAYVIVVNGGVSTPDAMRILDISDPKNPAQVGIFETLAIPGGVQVVGDYVFIAYDEGRVEGREVGSLRTIDVSNPALPREVGFLQISSPAKSVAVAGNKR